MFKYAVAIAVVVFGVAPSALAQGPAQVPYDNEQIARIKRDADQRRSPDLQNTAPAVESTTDVEPVTDAQPLSPQPQLSQPQPSQPCPTCPQERPHYDKVEVVKSSRDVDQSRVINTQSVVNVPARTREHNKLIVRENETRNVGVVQHNHTIIEKEIRYVKPRAPAYRAYRVQTTYQPVCQSGVLVYWIVRRGGEASVMSADVQVGYGNPCSAPCNCGGTVEAYAPRPVYRRSYSYDVGVPSHTVRIPLHAYGAAYQ